jgi:hypothetical protein
MSRHGAVMAMMSVVAVTTEAATTVTVAASSTHASMTHL